MTLTEDERRRGVVAASTGNHGQGIAYGPDCSESARPSACEEQSRKERGHARCLARRSSRKERDYDEAVVEMLRSRAKVALWRISTNDKRIVAGRPP
jgi:threonine dehydratase